jgi:hypothetical protein
VIRVAAPRHVADARRLDPGGGQVEVICAGTLDGFPTPGEPPVREMHPLLPAVRLQPINRTVLGWRRDGIPETAS